MRTVLAILSCSLLASQAQVPPSPTAAVATEESEPVTYQRTAEWLPSNTATGYRLVVNGSVTNFTTFTNAPVQLTLGTNEVQVLAFNADGISSPSVIRYFIAPLRITGCEVLCSSNLLTWTRTNLPPSQTNPAGSPLWFKLNPTLITKLDERHVE